ncbi:MAG: FecR domain-containing protein, partial [Elusimicrobia bacterium]|nr:FecR domain-containing protein [Elusimicrobiota bacterium]
MKKIGISLGVLILGVQIALAKTQIITTEGTVEVQRSGSDQWVRADVLPYSLDPSDKLRTLRRSKALLLFDDQSRIELSPKSTFILEQTGVSQIGMRLDLGRLRAWVSKRAGRRFEVRTPVAVAAVRGTEFGVEVRDAITSIVEVYSGLVAVRGMAGDEVLLNPLERVEVD